MGSTPRTLDNLFLFFSFCISGFWLDKLILGIRIDNLSLQYEVSVPSLALHPTIYLDLYSSTLVYKDSCSLFPGYSTSTCQVAGRILKDITVEILPKCNVYPNKIARDKPYYNRIVEKNAEYKISKG